MLTCLFLQQHRQRFQRGAASHQEESDDDETVTNVHPNLSQVEKNSSCHHPHPTPLQIYKPEDLSTPTKRPSAGSGFIINHSKAILLPDDQMDIDDDDDDDDDPNELVSDEDFRAMVIPSVVQASLKQQMNRKTKQEQQQQVAKDLRHAQNDEENNIEQEMNTARKKYQEKVS